MIITCFIVGVLCILVGFACGVVVGAYRAMTAPDLEKALLREENKRLRCLRSMDRLGSLLSQAEK